MTPPKHSLLKGDIGPHLRRLSIPLAFGMTSMTVFSVVDTYFVSRLGTQALAAIGFTLPVVMFFLGISFGLSVATSSVLSRVFGEGDFARVRQMSTDALVLAALIMSVAAVAGWLTIEPMFRMLGAKDELMPLIRGYMNIWYIGLPMFGLMIVGNSCMRALGDTRYASMIMTLMSVISLIFDPLFIFGFGPIPGMGLSGAALTVVTAYILTCAYSIYSLRYKKDALSPVLWHAGSITAFKRFMHIALPSMLSNQIAPISTAIITWMAAGFGKEAVAALGVASRIEGVCILVFYALAAGVSIFSGQNFGAGNFGRVGEACRIGVRYAFIWGAALAVLIWPFANIIPTLFDKNAEVIAYTAQYLHWVPVSFGAMGALVVINAALNATGRPIASTVLVMLRAVVIYVPLAWFLQGKLGFMGIVLALTLTNMLAGVMAIYWQRRHMSVPV